MSHGPVGDAGSEVVDVFDEHGRLVGTASRSEVRADRLWHRSVFIAVVSRDGRRVLAHQRAGWKDVWPGRWAVAFGGVLASGESYLEGARRELGEEAGLVGLDLRRLGAGRYDDGEVREHAEVFLVRCDGPVVAVDGEVVATAWVDLERLDGWLDDHTVCPDSERLVVPLLRPTVDGRLGAAPGFGKR